MMTILKGQEFGNLLWALATLNIPMGSDLEALVPYLQHCCRDSTGTVPPTSIAASFKRQELANIAWAAAVFGAYPPDLMKFLYTGLLGAGKTQNASFISRIHGDSGLQMQAVMTLIYVQASLDLESPGLGLKLPEEFPDGWQQLKPDRHDEQWTEIPFELNLHTSKVQSDVSNAFQRIGFKHIEEYIMTTEDAARDYGVNVPPKKMEILSVDIADLEQKIAIEVDGPSHFLSRIDVAHKSPPSYSTLVNGKLEYQFGWNGSNQEKNGSTTLKERLLQSFGWTVIHIPFWEWYALKSDPAAEEEYCRKILKQHVAATDY
jgi:hypothetical protein